jgi:DNA-binding transcriptional LysR family regulator
VALNLNQLRVFNAICDELSMTGAARRLHISQPAVSKQLAELEQALGAPLVDRLPRGLRLTSAGEVLAGHARRIFQTEQAAEAELGQLLGLRGGSLAIGASTTIGGYFVPPVLGEFHSHFPQVAIELRIGNTHAITEAVLAGQLDVGLTEGLWPGEGALEQVFAHDEMVAIVGARHPLVGQGSVTLTELQSLPWICREHGSGTREVIEAELAERGIRLSPVMSLGSTEAIKHAVAQGIGFAFVSRVTVELELQIGRLVALAIDGLYIRRALHLVTPRGKHPSAAAREFIARLFAHSATAKG